MTAPPSIALLTLLATVVVVVASGDVARHRGTAVANAFVAAVCALSLWGVTILVPDAVGLTTSDVPGWAAVEVVRVAAGGSVPVWFYAYVRLYTGFTRYSDRRRVGLLFVPLGVTVAVLALGAVTSGVVFDVVQTVAPAVVIGLYLYLAGLVLFGLFLLARLAQRYRRVTVGQVGLVSVTVTAPYLALFVSSLYEPTPSGGQASLLPVDIGFAGFACAGVAAAVAVRVYPVFRPLPGAEYIARDEVIENLADGVVVLDADDRIIDINEAAAELCPEDTDALGRPITAVFEELSVPPAATRRVELDTPDGLRQFEVTATPIRGDEDSPTGRTLRLRDVTERQTREQQLEVLTRVLRHNLRNDLDTALAYTNEIDDPEVRAEIQSSLDGLLAVGKKARDVEQLLAQASDDRATVDLVDLARSVADEHRTDGCRITVTGPERLALFTNGRLLRRLLAELVENGIEHNDADTPAVEIELRDTETTVEIEIADNGGGIPDHERAALESGTESPLQHGTGLGLWLANWIARSLGGELVFPDHSRSAVVVRLSDVAAENTPSAPGTETTAHTGRASEPTPD